jgi:hypothetical protein
MSAATDENSMFEDHHGQTLTELNQERKKIKFQKYQRNMKKALHRLAFQIFLLVADADGKIDSKEVTLFRDFLKKRADNCSNKYTRRIFHSTVIDYSVFINQYHQGKIKKDITQVEKVMTFVQKCVSPDILASICRDLTGLAKAIAGASGGFAGITNPISKEESNVIDKLEKIYKKAIQTANGPEDASKWLSEI